MEDFSRSKFEARDLAGRHALAAELSTVLTARTRGTDDFHQAAKEVVEDLRSSGHDLWSFDESDDFEIWCPNYKDQFGSGIIVTFEEGSVLVEWREAAGSTD